LLLRQICNNQMPYKMTGFSISLCLFRQPLRKFKLSILNFSYHSTCNQNFSILMYGFDLAFHTASKLTNADRSLTR